MIMLRQCLIKDEGRVVLAKLYYGGWWGGCVVGWLCCGVGWYTNIICPTHIMLTLKRWLKLWWSVLIWAGWRFSVLKCSFCDQFVIIKPKIESQAKVSSCRQLTKHWCQDSSVLSLLESRLCLHFIFFCFICTASLASYCSASIICCSTACCCLCSLLSEQLCCS